MRSEAFTGWAMLMLSFVGWVLTAGLGWIEAPAASVFAGYSIHAAVFALPGLVLVLGLVLLKSAAENPPDPAPVDLATARVVFSVVMITTAAVLVHGVTEDKLDPVRAALILFCGTTTLTLAFAVVRRLSDGAASLTFDSHWGGLGGGLGGWRISGLAVLIVLLILFASALVSVGLYDPDRVPAPKTQNNAGSGGDGGIQAPPPPPPAPKQGVIPPPAVKAAS